MADEGEGVGDADESEEELVLVDVDVVVDDDDDESDEVLSVFKSELESVVVSSPSSSLFGVVDGCDCGSDDEDELSLVSSEFNFGEFGIPIEAGRKVPGSMRLPPAAAKTSNRDPRPRPIAGMADTPKLERATNASSKAAVKVEDETRQNIFFERVKCE